MEIFKLLIIILTFNGAFESELEEKSFQKVNPVRQNFRLPNSTRPTFYNLHIKIHSLFFDFKGNVKIEIVSKESTNIVTLHSKDLKIQQIRLLHTNYTLAHYKLNFEFPKPKELEFLKVKLPKLMKKDESFVLDIDYSGYWNEEGDGLYRSFYYDDTITTNYYVASQFQPTFARRAFPCYDEPGIRAKFSIEIEHSKDYRAFSNTESIEQVASNETDAIITRFIPLPNVSTYTIMIAVVNFQAISNNDYRVPQQIIAPPPKINKGEANFARDLVGPILTAMEKQIGIKFPLTKLDHLAVDSFKYEVIDTYGLSTYRENILLLNSTQTDAERLEPKKRLIQIIARTHAQQYFGSMISPHWWTDLWIREGFVTLYEYFIPDVMYPSNNIMEIFREKHMKPLFDYDIRRNASSLPISNYVHNPEGIAFNFNNEIAKSKASVVLRMFQTAFSYDTFNRGITLYMIRRIDHSATPDDVFSALQEAVDNDHPNLIVKVQTAMSSWIYQAGYPIIFVSVDGNNLVVEQQRFPTTNGEIYQVPLTFASAKWPNFNITYSTFWLKSEKTTVPLQFLPITDKDWIIFNVQQTGFYRVSYTPNLWLLIADILRKNFNTIHVINRELLMTELKLGYEVLEEIYISDVFGVLTYLTNEDQYDVWLEAEKILKPIQYNFVGTVAYPNFLLFLQYITRRQLKVLTFENQDGEPEKNQHFRELLIDYNCHGLDPFCVKYQTDQLKLFLQGHNVVVHFCATFSKIITPAFVYFLKIIQSDLNFPFRYAVFLGLTCSSDKEQLQFLIQALENRSNVITDSERIFAISRMLFASNEGQPEALAYLEKYPDMLASKEIQYVLKKSINTKKDEIRVKEIIKKAQKSQYILFKDVIDMNGGLTERNLWHENNYHDIEEWFNKNAGLFTGFDF